MLIFLHFSLLLLQNVLLRTIFTAQQDYAKPELIFFFLFFFKYASAEFLLPQDGDGDTDPALIAIPIPVTILDRLLVVQLDRSVVSERIRRGRERLGEAERSTLSLGSADATAKSAERTYRASLRGEILAWDFRKQLLASFADPTDYPPRSARRKTSTEAIKTNAYPSHQPRFHGVGAESRRRKEFSNQQTALRRPTAPASPLRSLLH